MYRGQYKTVESQVEHLQQQLEAVELDKHQLLSFVQVRSVTRL